MQIDRYTKTILTLLTIGVWLLAAAIFVRPTPTIAYGDEQAGGVYMRVFEHVDVIRSTVNY